MQTLPRAGSRFCWCDAVGTGSTIFEKLRVHLLFMCVLLVGRVKTAVVSLSVLPIMKTKTPTPKKILSAKQQLALYKNTYWGGAQHDNHHWTVFGDLCKNMEGRTTTIPRKSPYSCKTKYEDESTATTTIRVLYPDCHRHMPPLFFFSDVAFADCETNVAWWIICQYRSR